MGCMNISKNDHFYLSGGYPIQPSLRGFPHFWKGVPHLALAGELSHLFMDALGYPALGWMGYPPPPSGWMKDMPLAFTQEDFLVSYFNAKRVMMCEAIFVNSFGGGNRICLKLNTLYRLGTVNSNTVNSKFNLIHFCFRGVWMHLQW